MKPTEMRAQRQAQDRERKARGEALERYLQNGADLRRVVPELIPSATDHVRVMREVRRLSRLADRTPRGTRRSRLLDDSLAAIVQLIYVERVMALDRLARAALTPADLARLSRVSTEELNERVWLLARADAREELQGGEAA